MALGRDESKHIYCQFEGKEEECKKDCTKCAISIKSNGDIAISQNQIDSAIRYYKKAVFAEPHFAEAWCNLANAYGMKSEYHNAIHAFDKAIAIDPEYGKALFGKAVTLCNLGSLDAAMELANQILELYDDSDVEHFKNGLVNAGVKDKSKNVDQNKALKALVKQAEEIMRENELLDENASVSDVNEEYCLKEFTESIYAYCKKKYALLGIKKVHGECIITSFYGSICATVF